MGNAASTQPGSKPSSSNHRRISSKPPTESSRTKSSSDQPHNRPLRHKKKSLELPDLASLGLGITPSASTSSTHRDRGRPAHSSPINIPVSPHLGGRARQRPQNNPSYIVNDSDDDETVAYKEPEPERRERGRQPRAPSRDHPPPAQPAPQIIHSAISTGLRKTNGAVRNNSEGTIAPTSRRSTAEDPVDVKIVWSGGGTNVVLARAGDDDWKGRTIMERESPESPNFFTIVSLLPGTHHIRFLVDDVWRISDDLPTAVDEQGSLANYVAVGLRVFSPSPVQPSPPLQPAARSLPPGSSFWVETPSGSTTNLPSLVSASLTPNRPIHPYESGRWTNIIPPQLILAAKEEEAYIAQNEQQPSGRHRNRNLPPIPPAPSLPRHLEKLILNVRSPGVSAPRPGGSPVGSKRTPDAQSSNRSMGRSTRRSTLGMSSADAEDNSSSASGSNRPVIPVTTASGTDVTRVGLQPLVSPTSPSSYALERSERERIEREKADRIAERAHLEPGLADDSSMLPVPNHVVLHHLSTSAIKNGLLAVACTNRYRKKYLTTVYYKPTDA